MEGRETLVIVDGHALLFRAYHALPPLSDPSGGPVHAVLGFMTVLLNVLKEIAPSHVVVAFDTPGPTFRHKAYAEYKATRAAPPEDLASQLVKLKDILRAFDILYVERPGYEADDLIGTIAAGLPGSAEAVIVTGDLDELQLVNNRTKVYAMRRGFSDKIIYDEQAVKERYGFGPELMIEYKSLRGDPSDNIPGVAGVGEKTACQLVVKYGTLEKIYKALSKLPETLRRKLEAGKEAAYLSRDLVKIAQDVKFNFRLADAVYGKLDSEKAKAALARYNFRSLMNRIGNDRQPEAASEPRSVVVKPRAGVKIVEGVDEMVESLAKTGDIPYVDLATLENEKFFSAFSAEEIFVILHPGRDELDRIGRALTKKKGLAGHNLKLIYRVLPGLAPPAYFDVMIAGQLIDPNMPSDDLAELALVRLNLKIESGQVVDLAAERAEAIRSLTESFASELKSAGLLKVFTEIELPLIPLLADIEDKGVLVNLGYLKKLSAEFEKSIAAVSAKIYKLAGREFNISSPAQLKEILFGDLALGGASLRKVKTGISTAASELIKLRGAHPIIDEIFTYRELTKLKSTYVDALPKLASSQDGRIHTNYNQIGAATGRLSSNNPNLQNIPIRTEIGNRIRAAFGAAPGHRLISADYSQIELRVVAHLANDKAMIDTFKKDLDIHTATATYLFNLPPGELTKEHRRIAKAVNFGVLYGQGPRGLSEFTGIPYKEAVLFIKKYFELYSHVKKYLTEVKEEARRTGFAFTMFGRRRPIPELASPNPMLKQAGERMAINMPVQGTATGDIIKLTMVRLRTKAPELSMIMQVHDELVFEVPEAEVEDSAKKIKKIMEETIRLRVPLKVDIESGKNWAEMTPVSF